MAIGAATILTVTLVTIISSVLYFYFHKLRTYWKRRNVPELGEGVFFGIYKDLMFVKDSINDVYRKAYEENRDLRYYGTFLFGRPTLVVHDIEIIKEILVKDFFNFSNHSTYSDVKKDPLSGNLFDLSGAKWKTMRNKLSATFTSSKMKYMFDTMQECIRQLQGIIEKELETNGEVTNLRDKLACLGTDIIASVAFGVEVNSLHNPKAEFRQHGRLMFAPSLKELLRLIVLRNAPWIAKLINLRIINPQSYEFIMSMVKNTVEYRENNNVERNDFLNLMIQLKNKGFVQVDDKDLTSDKTGNSGPLTHLTMDEVAAQVFIFFAAGFETTSTLTTFTLYELSVHKDIQRKVQEECDQILKSTGGQITYEAVHSMTYTNQVIHETLRFFPAMGALVRTVANDCTLPLTDLKLDEKTQIQIPIMGLHMDPRYFPNPDRFDPENFSEERKASRPSYVYMPFGEGPRICIGMRFALMQVKSILLRLLSKYDFDLTKDSPVPIRVDPKGVITTPEKVDFVVTKRNISS